MIKKGIKICEFLLNRKSLMKTKILKKRKKLKKEYTKFRKEKKKLLKIKKILHKG